MSNLLLDCKLCLETLDSSMFYKHKVAKSGFNSYCKECDLKQAKIYRLNNKEKIVKQRKEYYANNSKVILDKVKKYTVNNKEKIKTYKKKHYTENKPEIMEKARVYVNKKRRVDPVYKLKMNLRSRLRKVINGTVKKSKQTIEYLGCSYQELKLYIESKFTNGMNWENQGQWHVDHIIPLSTATSEEDLYKLCHYTNLQPLWAEDNLKKGCKILIKELNE